jgi:hypothetical protein
MEFFMGDGTREFRTVAGRDTYAGGWFYVVASVDKFTTLTAANVDEWGFRFNRTAQPRKLRNMYTDYFLYLDGYFITGGTAVDPVTLADIGLIDGNSSLGVVTAIDGAFFCTGELQIGNGAAATDFDMDGNVLIYTDQEVNAGLYRFVIDGTGVNAELRNSLFQSTGTTDDTRFIFDLSADNFTLTNVGCVLQRAAAVSFGSSQTINSWTFTDCFTITTNGATLSECIINDTASTSAVVLTAFTQIVDCAFNSDASNHAVELTGAVPSGYTWDHATTGYLAGSEGDFTTGTNANATIYINPTSADSTNLTITVPTGVTLPSIRFGTNYTGTVTVQRQAKTIDVNVTDEDGNPVSGAFVYINDGATTIFNGTTDASGNIPQQSYGGTSNSTLRVRQFGKAPFQATIGTASGDTSTLATLLTDDQQIAVPTLNNTWTINTTGQTITMTSGPTLPFSAYSAIDTAQDLYEFVMNTFAATSFMQFPVPLESVTRTQYNFINGYTFGAKDNDHKFIYGGSYSDAASNLEWSNVKTIGTVETGTGIYVVQGVEASDTALTSWWPDGNIDVLVKVKDGTFIQSTDDTATNVDGAVWLFAREYGDLYDHFFVDLSEGGQAVAALSTNADLNNDTASGTVAAYTDVTTTFGSTSQDIGDGNGNQPYNVIVNCNGRTLKEVYERTKYITSFDFSQTVNGDDGFEYRNADEANFSNSDNKQAPFGTFAGGRFFGARGVFLTNIASSDITKYELIDSNGVARFPPLQVAFALTGLKDATEIRIFNSSTDTEIAGIETITNGTDVGGTASAGVTVSGSTDNNTFVYTYTYSSDIPIFVVILSLGLQITRLSNLTLGNTSQSIPVSQVIDRVYNNPP